MKTLVVAVVLVVAIAGSVVASSLELDGGNGQMVGQVYLSRQVYGQLGVFAYGQMCQDWSQCYAGPSWSPSEGLSLAVGAGREQGSEKTRFGGSIYFSEGRFSANYIREYGGSGLWDRWEIDYQVSPKIGLGLTNRVYTNLEKGINGVITYPIDARNMAKLSLGEAGIEFSWIVSR